MFEMMLSTNSQSGPNGPVYLDVNGVTFKASEDAESDSFYEVDLGNGQQWYYVVASSDLQAKVNLFKNEVGTNVTKSITDKYGTTKTIPLNQVVTSSVTSMSGMFRDTNFNQDIGSWDTSNVIYMATMFRNTAEFNQDISSWNTSNVTNMADMFRNTAEFNQDISSWNTSNVTNMGYMFHTASSFNQPIGSWDTSSVIYMDYMFNNASVFNQDISQWCVTKIPSKPGSFDTNTPVGFNSAKQPQWGTCPRGEI